MVTSKPLLVTFAIATHNRGQTLIDCLRRTFANGLPQSQFEIIVIDNASTDGTAELFAAAFANNPRMQLIGLKSNCGPVAKNIAIRKARGEFIVLLDDDAYPGPGAVPQMIRHFRDNPALGAAVFDVTLPDGSKDSAAYPDVFIGAGTGLRKAALHSLPGNGLLPAHFFMQAEEYDLSFRLLEAGYSIQRFWDLPLTHLKTPSARIGQRTTCLDVRNNLFLLAKYIPDPLAHQFAADWMSRYWMMAEARDEATGNATHPTFGTHRDAYTRGAKEGLDRWNARHANGKHLLSPSTIERIFKFQKIRDKMRQLKDRTNAKKILFADFGKNMLAYWLAAQDLDLEIQAIADDRLAPTSPGEPPREYRGIPLVTVGGANSSLTGAPDWQSLCQSADLIIVSNMSPVHAPQRAAALRRVVSLPVVDLFSRRETLLQHGTSVAFPSILPTQPPPRSYAAQLPSGGPLG